jgi:hypothetical protein
MTNSEWSKSLKVGDEVVVSTHYHVDRIEHVVKITPTGLIDVTCPYGDGKARFDQWGCEKRKAAHRDVLHEPTQEWRDKIEKARLIAVISNLNWAEMSLDKLRQVKRIVDGEVSNEAKIEIPDGEFCRKCDDVGWYTESCPCLETYWEKCNLYKQELKQDEQCNLLKCDACKKEGQL